MHDRRNAAVHAGDIAPITDVGGRYGVSDVATIPARFAQAGPCHARHVLRCDKRVIHLAVNRARMVGR